MAGNEQLFSEGNFANKPIWFAVLLGLEYRSMITNEDP